MANEYLPTPALVFDNQVVDEPPPAPAAAAAAASGAIKVNPPYERINLSEAEQMPAYRCDGVIARRNENIPSTYESRVKATSALSCHLDDELSRRVKIYYTNRENYPYYIIRSLYENARLVAMMASTTLRTALDTITPKDDEAPEDYVERGYDIADQLALATRTQLNETTVLLALSQGLLRSKRYAAASSSASRKAHSNTLTRYCLIYYMAAAYTHYKEVLLDSQIEIAQRC